MSDTRIPSVLWGVSLGVLFFSGLFLAFPNARGDYRRLHRRACAAEFRAARSLADTLRVVVEDAYCGSRMGKDS